MEADTRIGAIQTEVLGASNRDQQRYEQLSGRMDELSGRMDELHGLTRTVLEILGAKSPPA
eukprot:107369-Prymnesium_polylepis.1